MGIQKDTTNPPRILIIDDTEDLARTYTQGLSKQGYNATYTTTGAGFMRHLAREEVEPDLLILDVKLPDTDGLQLLGELKLRGFNASVIIITGHASMNMAIEAMRSGASDFLVKPFALAKLYESVEKAIGAPGLSAKSAAIAADQAMDKDADQQTASQSLTAAPNKTVAANPSSRPHEQFSDFVGISPPMQTVYDIIESAAPSNATVFITGESGTGKELCAEALHRFSRRAQAPFIALNCAAIPRELLESELFGHVKGAFTGAVQEREGAVATAHGGTLFLDEIAEMAPDMQTKLLRFLQTLSYRKVGGTVQQNANVRIICATNRDPRAEIAAGRLREDLYYRLHVIPIHMPPLRARKQDIIDLADYFLRLYAKEEGKSFKTIARDAEKILLTYSWPGNVRELQNVIRGAVVLHDHKILRADMLPPTLSRESPARVDAAPKTSPTEAREQSSSTDPITDDAMQDSGFIPLWQIEKAAIEKAIALCGGNIPRAAALLEISPSTIYRKKMGWEQPGNTPHSGGGSFEQRA